MPHKHFPYNCPTKSKSSENAYATRVYKCIAYRTSTVTRKEQSKSILHTLFILVYFIFHKSYI